MSKAFRSARTDHVTTKLNKEWDARQRKKMAMASETPEPSSASRQIAFAILTRHGECLADDVSMNDLIDDIASEIDKARAK